jgi:hypothetical protein
MNLSPRLTRTPPEQTGPLRNPMAPPQERKVPGGPPPDLFTAAGATVCGVLENGVRTAYAVIDEYMRRGQDAARTIFNDPNRRGFMSDNRSNFPGAGYSYGGGYPPSGGGYPPSNPMAMLAEQWMMMMRMWSNAFSSIAPGQWPMPGPNPYSYPGATSVPVTLKIEANRPVELTANVYAGPDGQALISDSLKSDGSGGSPIESPSVIRDGMSVRVTLKVTEQQPSGVYRGSIRRKSDGFVVGDLIVVLG